MAAGADHSMGYAGMVVEPPLMGAIAVWTGSLRASVLAVGVILLLGISLASGRVIEPARPTKAT